jgi:hypothetical protein
MLAAGVLGLAALACRGAPRTTTTTLDASEVDAAAEAAKLAALLPPALGPFKATGPAMQITGSGMVIGAQRSYGDGSGKTALVELETGDVRVKLDTIDGNEPHNFGSDSPSYWRSATVLGHRARISEEQPVIRTSECYVQVEPNHVATVRVHPAIAGECATLATLLDFKAIAATGGVPCPSATGRR